MANFFQDNIKLLHDYQPDLAVRLGNHVPSLNLELFDTSSGAPSLRIHHDKNGQTTLLHSSRDPLQEAQRWAANVTIESPFHLMVLGCGLMHHVFQLVQICKKTLSQIVIIEDDIDVVHAAFTAIDLSPYLLTKSVYFFVQPTPTEIRSHFNANLTQYSLNGLSLIRHQASCDRNPAYYNQVATIVHESMQGGEILLRTKVQIGAMIQENIIRNFPVMLKSPNVSTLRDLFAGKPCYIIGAGPSLDQDIESIKQIGVNAVIIAVDTAYKALCAAGTPPHIVVSTDPTALNAKHFEGVTDLGSTTLVYSPSLYHEAAAQLQGTKVTIPMTSSKLLATLPELSQGAADVKIGTNVGQTCFYLARYMGCAPIILIGLDFSFPKEGGTTHFNQAAFNRKIEIAETPGKMRVELIGDKPEWEEFDPIFVPSNAGGEAATSKFWLAYLRSLEEEIKSTTQDVINCSATGAKVEGALFQPLSQVIEQFSPGGGGADPSGASETHNTLALTVGFFFGDHSAQGLDVLNMAMQILQLALQHAGEGLQKAQELDAELNAQEPRNEKIADLLQQIHACHTAAVQEQKLYVVLDEAADQVLAPFLRLQNRPRQNASELDNARRSADRYIAYFTGILDVAGRFQTVIEETIRAMGAPPSDPFSDFTPPSESF
ncbi:MAG: DUF115 domain-containing protein [Candidatus Hinthialibacter antarcticus]|nr:DUF115 domain-containing protein [Candidatus Hinthialibacter antarcticus]